MVIAKFVLMLVCLLLEADAPIGTIHIELAEWEFKQPLRPVQDDKENPQHFYLLQGMGGLVTLHLLRESLFFIRAHKDVWAYRQCRESLFREMCRVYRFQFHHDIPVIIPPFTVTVLLPAVKLPSTPEYTELSE